MQLFTGPRFHPVIFSLILSCSIPVLACSNTSGDKEKKDGSTPRPARTEVPVAPADTIDITQPSAVFYTADSVHQAAFKKQFGEADFDGVDHECFYQMKNARTSLQEHWPQIRIYEVKNSLVLRFTRSAGSSAIVDLRKKNDLCGLYLFTPEKDPLPGDMMNIGTSLENYFTR